MSYVPYLGLDGIEYQVEIRQDYYVNDIGNICYVNYKTPTGQTFYSVASIVLPEYLNQAFNAPICIPQFIAIEMVKWALDQGGELLLPNWIITSANDLLNMLNSQTTALQASITSGGGGGIDTATKNMIINIQSGVNTIKSQLTTFSNDTSNKLNVITTGINAISSSLTVSTNNIISAIQQQGGLTDTGLLNGISDIVASGYEWVNSAISSFDYDINTLFTWADGMVAAVNQAFLDQFNNVADAMTSSMTFISNEIFSAFDSIIDKILTPLNLLGDISDFLTMDFLDWLNDMFDINLSDVENNAGQFIDMFKRMVEKTSSLVVSDT